MDRAVQFHPLFATDIAEAAEWYDACGPGLGDRFCDAVKDSLSTIIADPDPNPVLDALPTTPKISLSDCLRDESVHAAPVHCGSCGPLARAMASAAWIAEAWRDGGVADRAASCAAGRLLHLGIGSLHFVLAFLSRSRGFLPCRLRFVWRWWLDC